VKSGKSKHQRYGYGNKISLIHRCSFHLRIALAALLVRAAAPKRIPVTVAPPWCRFCLPVEQAVALTQSW